MNHSKQKVRSGSAILIALVIVLVFTTGLALADEPSGYSWDEYASIDRTNQVSNPDWMAALPDSVRFSELSLPGSHDTMTYNCPSVFVCNTPIVLDWAMTQTKTLATQLDLGIRVLDLRLHRDYDLIKGEWVLNSYHTVLLGGEFGNDVLKTAAEFLDAHPNEAVFMMVGRYKSGEARNKPSLFEETFKSYYDDYGGYILGRPGDTFNSNPTLGDVRGKIVFIEDYTFQDGTTYGIVKYNWEDQNNWGNYGSLYGKWVLIRDHLDQASTGSMSTVYINLLSASECKTCKYVPIQYPWFIASGNQGPQTGTPNYYTGYTENNVPSDAKEDWKDFPRRSCDTPVGGLCIDYEGTNELTMQYINDGKVTKRVGIILADFPGAGLVNAIIGLNPENEPPVADAGGPYDEDVNEGSPITFDASASKDPNSRDTLQYRWDFENDGTWDTEWSTTPTATHTFYDDFVGNARVEVSDGKFTDEATASVIVNNVAPKITDATSPNAVKENDEVTIGITFTDPGTQDTFTVEINWDDGITETYDYGAGTRSFSKTHRYLDDKPSGAADFYDIKVTVTDDNEGAYTGFRPITVNNVAPEVTASGDEINEDGVATVSGDITDPGTQDAFKVEINWGDGITETYNYGAGAVGYSETHQYLDDKPGDEPDVYPVSVMITDDDGGEGIASTTVAVNNVAPVASIDHITDEAGNEIGVDVPVALVGVSLDVVGSFTDVGTLDTHTASLNWGDGMVDDATGTIAGSHIYTAPDTYTIELTVTDDDTGQGVQTASVTIVDASGAITTLLDQLSGFGGNPYIARAYDFLAGTNGSNDDNGALAELSKGNLNAAMVKIKQAMEELEAAEADDATLDLTIAKSLLALTAKSIAVDTLGQAEAAAKNPADEKKVDKAAELVAEGNDLLGAQDYLGAVESYLEAVREASPVF